MAPVEVSKDGQSWWIGTADDVAWIAGHTIDGLSVTAAIPPRFEAYATFYPLEGADITLHEHTIVDILKAHTPPQPWWLGYLDTGGPRHRLQYRPTGDALLGLEVRPCRSRPGASTDVAGRSHARRTHRLPP
jgi:hypothetical protein